MTLPLYFAPLCSVFCWYAGVVALKYIDFLKAHFGRCWVAQRVTQFLKSSMVLIRHCHGSTLCVFNFSIVKNKKTKCLRLHVYLSTWLNWNISEIFLPSFPVSFLQPWQPSFILQIVIIFIVSLQRFLFLYRPPTLAFMSKYLDCTKSLWSWENYLF